MRWCRWVILSVIGLCIGLASFVVSDNLGNHTTDIVADAASTYTVNLHAVNEENPSQTAFGGYSEYQGKDFGLLDQTITVNFTPTSGTTYRELFAEYLKENPGIVADQVLQSDIPLTFEAASNYINGIWDDADVLALGVEAGVSYQGYPGELGNFVSEWTSFAATDNYVGAKNFALDSAKFNTLLDSKVDLTTTDTTLDIPFEPTTEKMTVNFKTSDGSTLPNYLGAVGNQGDYLVPRPSKTIQGYLHQTVDADLFIPTFTGYTADKSSVTFNADDSQTETVVYITAADLKTTTIHYQYADGTTAAPDAVKYGYKNATGEESSSTVTAPTITGFTASQASVPVNFDYAGKTADITVTYTKAASSSAGNSAATTDSSSTSSTPDVTGNTADEKAPVQKETIYATKKLGLYRTPNFSKQTREFYYAKRTRTNRPQFVVTGYARSKQGRLRYKVVDVNHNRRTAGKVGYITANEAFTTATYFQSNPKRVKVLRDGVKSYRQASLKTVVHRYRQGQVLKVKKLVRYHLTTRLLLSNGEYVSANKTLSIKQ